MLIPFLCLRFRQRIENFHHRTTLLFLQDLTCRYLFQQHFFVLDGLTHFIVALSSFQAGIGDATLFSSVLNQTIAPGLQEGWVDPQQLAVDGMRLRAHASTKAIRTLERSTKRLPQLAQVDTSTLDPQHPGWL